ncbi:hypothetical protein IC582_004589 [Cucumis melo]|uniref:Protein RETICULATA-RELATED 5, chloroplastic n=2 Tax=Cucumis melo TaxID=3656 RepID=A0A1S3B3L7_CUCME|nr:protein RETICULATA-RELATED 5, chloroplastic [Cucumis melo]KAA0054986.1 protein RETICULATA-RELATED 5 [Cucumis melo var. makuwa]
MKLHFHGGFTGGPVPASSTLRHRQNSISECRFVGEISIRRNSCASFPIGKNSRSSFPIHCLQDSQQDSVRSNDVGRKSAGQILSTRRAVLGVPLIAIGAQFLQSAVVRAEEKSSETVTPVVESVTSPSPSPIAPTAEEEVITSRIYDATVIGEPLAVGKDKSKVWEKIMNARVVYLGEAEQVPIRDDKELELEIVKSLKRRCGESERTLSVALEAFPSDLQEQLNQYIDKTIDGETLKSYTAHWPPQRWQEYEPLLSYCRVNGVRLIACGTPLKVLRIVQAEGIKGLSKADRKLFAPPAGSGFISGFTAISRRTSADLNSSYQPIPFGPSSYLSAQSRVVEEYAMSQIILQAMQDGGGTGMLVVVTGASHVAYGSRGTGLPARISRKVPKKNQVVVLLDPERQQMRREGEVPVADFLWYSAARPCSRNCFDRAEIARVMNAAGRKRDGLPQDIQKGLDLGVVSPEVLQNFFDLEQYPLISELTHRFQGFRERLLADPKFLHRLAIEEAISLTTTLLAQYERRKENFFLELDYVITDTLRGAVVDFFTVWLPAPTLAFLSTDDIDVSGSTDILQGLLGSIPDNAFQKNLAGKNWNLSHRVASVIFGGLKLASVGFISSIGAVASSNALFTIRKFLNPALATKQRNKRSPILKTAAVYGCFLGTSANLRYQIIAGIVEHRFSDAFSSQILLVNMLSFVVRTLNSYWGTQQWIDLARFTGLQTRESPSYQVQESPNSAGLGCHVSEEATQASPDEFKNQ